MNFGVSGFGNVPGFFTSLSGPGALADNTIPSNPDLNNVWPGFRNDMLNTQGNIGKHVNEGVTINIGVTNPPSSNPVGMVITRAIGRGALESEKQFSSAMLHHLLFLEAEQVFSLIGFKDPSARSNKVFSERLVENALSAFRIMGVVMGQGSSKNPVFSSRISGKVEIKNIFGPLRQGDRIYIVGAPYRSPKEKLFTFLISRGNSEQAIQEYVTTRNDTDEYPPRFSPRLRKTVIDAKKWILEDDVEVVCLGEVMFDSGPKEDMGAPHEQRMNRFAPYKTIDSLDRFVAGLDTVTLYFKGFNAVQ